MPLFLNIADVAICQHAIGGTYKFTHLQIDKLI